MKILAIDTSSNACSVALLVDDQIHVSHQIAPMQQAQRILNMINELMIAANVSLSQLDALAFGCGPGSFTGVRVSASVIQGLAFATQVPVIKISSLAAVAQSAYIDLGWKKLLVVMDARIREVYWGAYQVNAEGLVELVGEEAICPPQELHFMQDGDWYGVGNGWQVYRDSLTFKPIAEDDTYLPNASAIIPLAVAKHLKREWIAPHEALPVYLRDHVAVKENNR